MLLSLCTGPLAQEAPDSGEDFFIVHFSTQPGERLTLDCFAQLAQEATGQGFTWAPEVAGALAATAIMSPATLRVRKSEFAAYARDQFLLHGFGCFGGQQDQWTIRPVPPALVRLAYPEQERTGFTGRGHARAFVPPEGKPLASGVVVNEPGATPGPLLVSGPGASASLLDPQGRTIRAWNDPERLGAWELGGGWEHVTPLADGGLLCVDSSGEVLLRLAPDGRVRWRRALPVHHAALALADGSFFVLTRRPRLVPEIDPTRRVVDHLVTHVSAEGEVLAEHSLLELLATGPGAIPLKPKVDLEHLPPGYDLDLLHAASLYRVDEAQRASEPFRPGQLLVALRNLDRVALVDLESRSCVWSSSAGRLRDPHDARILPDGNVLVLDGLDPSGTRVIALDPRDERVEWEVRGARHGSSSCAGQGRVEQQANGNVLVGLPEEAFEVTRDGKLVWRHRNPPPNDPGWMGVSWSRPSAEWLTRLEPALETAPR